MKMRPARARITDSVDVELGEGEAGTDSACVADHCKVGGPGFSQQREWLYQENAERFLHTRIEWKVEGVMGQGFMCLRISFFRLATPTLDLRLSTMTRSEFDRPPRTHEHLFALVCTKKTRIATTAHVMESVP